MSGAHTTPTFNNHAHFDLLPVANLKTYTCGLTESATPRSLLEDLHCYIFKGVPEQCTISGKLLSNLLL